MAQHKVIRNKWGTAVLILSLLLFFFALPHTLEDFATGEPAKAGVPAFILAYVIAGMFALQGLGLFWVGQQASRGYFIHVFLGLFWPVAAGVAQLPTIFSEGAYRAGFISVFYVGGMIIIGILLFVTSLWVLRTNQHK